jgi:hypothetical protein
LHDSAIEKCIETRRPAHKSVWSVQTFVNRTRVPWHDAGTASIRFSLSFESKSFDKVFRFVVFRRFCLAILQNRHVA